MDFVPVRSYDNYINAHLDLGFLQEQGINCHIKDEHVVTIDPFLSPALGGMKLMVAEVQAERAMGLLEETEAAYIATLTCPHCHHHELKKIVNTTVFEGFWGKLRSLLLNGQESDVRVYYTCSFCHHHFEDLPLPQSDASS